MQPQILIEMTKETREKATKHTDKSSTIQTSLQCSTQTQTMLGLSNVRYHMSRLPHHGTPAGYCKSK
jgi:hypothetical protein